MDQTVINLTCTGVRTSASTTEYKIDAVIVSAGELPKAAVFVYTINQSDRVSTDVFARVATPQDMQELKDTRGAAIAAKQSEYLGINVSLSFPTVDVAAQAKTVLSSRINSLVKDWLTYTNQFVDEDLTLYFPTNEATVEEGLKTGYTEAVTTTKAAVTAVAAADLAVELALKDQELARQMVDAWQYSVTFLTVESYDPASPPAIPPRGFRSLLDKFYAEIDSPGPGTDASTVWNNGAEGSVIVDIQNYLAYCKGQLEYWKSVLSVANTSYASATNAQITAEQNYKVAEKAEVKAKAAILAVCPDYNFS